MARAVHALLLALRDLPHPRVLRVLAASLALTLLIFGVAGAAIFFAVRWALEHWKWLDGVTLDMAGVLVVLLLIAASWPVVRAATSVVVMAPSCVEVRAPIWPVVTTASCAVVSEAT